MQINNLPTTFGQWKRYFDVTYNYVNDIVPRIAFGQNKVDLIITNLQIFRTNYLTNHPPTITAKESRVLFDFFKTCAAFISFSSQYTAKNLLNYAISHPVNEQFNELSLLWTSWNLQSSNLICNSFMDINQLSFAHSLDLKSFYYAFFPIYNRLPVPVANALKSKLDDMAYLLKKIKSQADKHTPGIMQHNQFSIIKEIGKGAYATVSLAKMIPSGKEVAVKELKSVQLSKRNIISLKRELNALLQLKHPNIIEFIGITVTSPFCIATRFLSNGSLFDAIHGKTPLNFSPTARLKIALGIIRGLEYLDAMRYIHRDLKPQNILLDNQNNPVICDFGLSRQNGPNMTCELGTVQWAAPEIIMRGETNYDSQVDIYSFAIIVYELVTNTIPYRGYFQTQIAALVTNNERPELPETLMPEMKALIKSCWETDSGKRPKAEVVRKTLESGNVYFEGTDRNEYLSFVNSTKPLHESIMKHALERADHEMSELIAKLHTMNPLDPTAPSSLQQLYQMDYPLTLQLFDDILRLTNQNLSIPVQDAAFDIMKQILSREKFAEVIDPAKVVDEIITMVDSQPLFVIAAIKLIANKIKDVPAMIQKFLQKSQSHLTLEMVQAIISQNKERITPSEIVNIYNSLTGKLAVGYFRFMLTLFGPLPEFLPLACHQLFTLSLYFKELSVLCELDHQKAIDIIDIEDVRKEGKSSLQQLLYSISIVLVNQNTEVNEKMANIIYKYIINNCFTYNTTDIILPLLNICSKVGQMKALIAQSDIWNLIIGGLTTEGEELENSLSLIEKIPICPDTTLRLLIWKTLVDKYIKTKETNVTHAMCSLLKRRADFDLTRLLPALVLGISSDDTNYCVSALKLARRIKVEMYPSINTETFWRSLTRQMAKKDEVVCKSIGKLVAKMVDIMNDFTFDQTFFGAVISLLYDPNTSFETALPFIVFLGASCRVRKIVIFLFKRYFVRYLEQLPWRYENEARVADAIEYCASTMSRFYSASA